MKKETVYHFIDKRTGVHHYFGSIVSLLKAFQQQEIRLTKRALYLHDFTQPFENDFCTIYKGEVSRSKHSFQQQKP